jgi:TfoX/Sxy family transcriptional regulator of competence genes
MTAASDALAGRLRPLLAKKAGLEEKKMFGGVGFMLGGNMLIGTTAKGALLVRIDSDKAGDALARGAELMHMGPRVMSGFVSVDVAKLGDDAALKDWIAYATTYVKTLPPK